MTIFRSAGETRRRRKTAEVEGSKWRERHEIPFGPTNFLFRADVLAVENNRLPLHHSVVIEEILSVHTRLIMFSYEGSKAEILRHGECPRCCLLSERQNRQRNLEGSDGIEGF